MNSFAVGDAATCNLTAAMFSGWGRGGARGGACGGAILLILKAEVWGRWGILSEEFHTEEEVHLSCSVLVVITEE